jgi:L-alanine-DL-glutamate epimerase-like enolase superfamily enzyme
VGYPCRDAGQTALRSARAQAPRKTSILIAANLAFLAKHEDAELLEYSASDSPPRWELANESLAIDSDGMVSVLTAPGLGVTLSDAALRKFRVA